MILEPARATQSPDGSPPSEAIRELPYIDEHATVVLADPQRVWGALGRVLERRGGRLTAVGVRLLGARPARSGGDPLRRDSTIPGFAVVQAEPAAELCLAGRHRFARYALRFRLESHDGATTLRAQTRAAFRGAAGSAYRTLVISGGAHEIAVRRLLDRTRRYAEAPLPTDPVGLVPRTLRTLAAAASGAIGRGGDRDSARVRATWNGAVLAESQRTIVIEGNHYFPPEDVDYRKLQPSAKTTTCWWKGTASYYDVIVEDARVRAAAWTYRTPHRAAGKIADHVAFWGGVEVQRSPAA